MSVVIAAVGKVLDPATRAWVADATAYSRFAGPDGDDTEIGEQCGLGHALLCTGRGETRQPITLDGRVWLSADARLDDRACLLSGLRGMGQRVDAGADDAELVLHAYAAWRERLLEHLAGDFSFVLWDGDRRRLICACDQIGVISLRYATLGDRLLVASSPELLLLHPDVPDGLNEGALADFLLTGQPTSFGTTAFEAIRRLPPGHVLSWSDGELGMRRYWRAPEFEPLLRLAKPAEYVAYFRHLVDLAVGDRVVPGPLAAFLSGGMDSTTIMATAQRLRAGDGAAPPIRAVTGVLGAATGDREGEWARLVADSLGIEFDLIDESQFEPTDPLAEPRFLPPEPTPYQWSDAQSTDDARSRMTCDQRRAARARPGRSAPTPNPGVRWLRRGSGSASP